MIKEALTKQAQSMESSPMTFFMRNGHLLIISLFTVLLGGVYALIHMPIESDPEVKIPIGVVMTVYPGASPSDVEKLVTDKLEDRLKDLDDLKNLTSSSVEGMSSITVEFEATADLQESIRNLRDEVDSARVDLPSQAEDPTVIEIRAGDRAIATFTLIGTQPPEEFKFYAEELQDRIESISGVSKVEISGIPEREMQVIVDRASLEGLGLSISDITRVIAANHIDVPIGRVNTDGFYYQVSLKAQMESVEDFESMVIATREGGNILLRDVAEVRRSFASTSTETRLYRSKNGQYVQAVAVGLFKKTGADLVRMVDAAKEELVAFRKELPAGMDVIVTDDESDRIRQDINQLITSAWQTVIIIAITLYLALGGGEALAAATSVPILYLLSMMGLAFIGETFNFLTFFALILSLGVVIDTSIVIVEGIYENMTKHNMQPREAAMSSVAMFRAPLISGTLTTLAAFLPLGLMTGIMGEYVKHIPITVNITLVASLITALMILPAIAMFILSRRGDKKPPKLHRIFDRLGEWYEGVIHNILYSQKRRRLWIAGMTVAFFFSGVLFATGIVKFKLFSSVDTNLLFVNVELPEGASLEQTKMVTQTVEHTLEETPELKRFVTVYGRSAGLEGSSTATNLAGITLTLSDPDQRDIKSYEIANILRRALVPISGGDVSVEEVSAGPPSGAPIQVRLLGNDIRTVEEFSAQIEDVLEDIPGTTTVKNDLRLSPGEYHLLPKRDRLQHFGVTAQDIGFALRTAVFGDTSIEINREDGEEDVTIRLDFRDIHCVEDPVNALLETRDSITLCRSEPQSIAALLSLQIPTQKGLVLLSELVEAKLASAVTTIRHYQNLRVVNVTANVEEGVIPADVFTELQERVASMDIPEGISVEYGGENEDTAESMASLGRASVLALLLIFVILTYQFKSFRQVIIIFSAMPLAVMGVLYGLAVIQLPLSFPGMIGMVALLGIVVNDAIVLIDKINQNRPFAASLTQAVEQGCRQRLEPVIMTTITTAFGVIPLIFTGETFRDLAIVVAIGITVATLFTLVVIPILYVMLESEEWKPLSWLKVLWHFFRKKGVQLQQSFWPEYRE